MTETPIDRLARAAWGKTPKCDLQGVSKGPCSLDDECDCWRMAKANIRAILLELREPGERAFEAADRLTPADSDNMQCPDFYRHVIDAILAEGKA